MTERAKILIVDDDDSIRNYIMKLLTNSGYEVLAAAGGREALQRLRGGDDLCLVLLDIVMPEMDGLETLGEIRKIAPDLPIVMLSALGQTNTIVKAMKAGANDYLVKPFEEDELEHAVIRAIEKKRILAEAAAAKKPRMDETKGEFVFTSPKMQAVRDTIDQVANTDVSVLVEGESGTGKELVARALHYRSAKRDKPFVKVNCAALPHELLESELFGYERGAFTGAYKAKAGKFELANGGTIFLDEIGEIDMAIQAKLLQVLQEGTFARLGGKADVSVDVRIIAATNRDLKTLSEQGKFREDIYYRLNVVSIKMPALSERPGDITYLFDYFLDTYNEKYGKQIVINKDDIYPLLLKYPWPGNVREIKNLVKRLVILGNVEDFKQYLGSAQSISSVAPTAAGGLPHFAEEESDDGRIVPLKLVAKEAAMKAERKMIMKALTHTNWNKKKAAGLLEISYKALLYKIKECGLE